MRGLTLRPQALLVACLLLSACSGEVETVSPDVLDCGVEEQQMGTNLNHDARQCLLDAYAAGTPARFESRLTTVEGDPIVRTYLVVGPSEVRIEHDARRDRWGSGTIEILSCPRIVPVDEWNRVMNDEMRAEEVFVEDGCQQIGTR